MGLSVSSSFSVPFSIFRVSCINVCIIFVTGKKINLIFFQKDCVFWNWCYFEETDSELSMLQRISWCFRMKQVFWPKEQHLWWLYLARKTKVIQLGYENKCPHIGISCPFSAVSFMCLLWEKHNILKAITQIYHTHQ